MPHELVCRTSQLSFCNNNQLFNCDKVRKHEMGAVECKGGKAIWAIVLAIAY